MSLSSKYPSQQPVNLNAQVVRPATSVPGPVLTAQCEACGTQAAVDQFEVRGGMTICRDPESCMERFETTEPELAEPSWAEGGADE